MVKGNYNADKKKHSVLNELITQVSNAEDAVAMNEAAVSSLTDKLASFNTELTTAQEHLQTSLANKKLMDQVIAEVASLDQESNTTVAKMEAANSHIMSAASKVSSLIDQLIYAADLINKLTELIVRKKALNPLISDELVTRVTATSADANNAVALTLTALQSVVESQTDNIKSQAVLKLSNQLTRELNEQVVYRQQDAATDAQLSASEGNEANPGQQVNIADMLLKACHNYQVICDSTLIAVENTRQQLTEATQRLDHSKARLKTLKASLAAAEAAGRF